MSSNAWLFWALASAGFASLTAIFAKMGLQGIDSDFATFIRTLVILAALVLFLTYTGKWQGVNGFTGRNWTFLILSGLATGASWLAYFKALQLGNASQVAPVDKFSLALGRPDGRRFLRRTPKHSGVDRLRLGNRRRIDFGFETIKIGTSKRPSEKFQTAFALLQTISSQLI